MKFWNPMVSLCFVLQKTASLPKWLYHFTFPSAMNESSCCYTFLRYLMLSVFWFSHFSSWVVVFHCCFILHFPDIWPWAFFHIFIYYLYIYLSIFKSGCIEFFVYLNSSLSDMCAPNVVPCLWLVCSFSWHCLSRSISF